MSPASVRPLLLAVDGGQTGSRAVLMTGDRVLEVREGAPIRHLFGEGEETRSALAQLLAGITESISVAALGLTSVRPGSREAGMVERMVREMVPVGEVMVVPDYVTALLGASAGEPGIAVIAGGGMVAYGRTAHGREAVAGGDGYLLGDEGSAYWIGRHAVAAALRAADGRGSPTALTEAVTGAFALHEIGAIKAVVYAPGFQRDRLAALAPRVMELARAGDATATEIVEGAARALAGAAIAVARQLDGAADVFPVGGVFRGGEIIMEPFQRVLAGRGLAVRSAVFSPVAGAALLAADASGVPRESTLSALALAGRPE